MNDKKQRNIAEVPAMLRWILSSGFGLGLVKLEQQHCQQFVDFPSCVETSSSQYLVLCHKHAVAAMHHCTARPYYSRHASHAAIPYAGGRRFTEKHWQRKSEARLSAACTPQQTCSTHSQRSHVLHHWELS